MIVRVLFFAQARDIAGKSAMDVTLGDESNVGDLKQLLCETLPGLESLLSHATMSVDHEYASDHTPLYHGAEAAVIPPVSGG